MSKHSKKYIRHPDVNTHIK